jgi:uncharacterized protein
MYTALNNEIKIQTLVGLVILGLFVNACGQKGKQENGQKFYFVTDSAFILSGDQEAKLTEQLRNLERNIGSQMAILTIESLHGEKIEDYSLRTAKHWKLGRKDYDDGILITIALHDRQLRIEVGYGLEKIISNDLAAQIIRDDMIPNFKNDRYYEGLMLAIDKITELIKDNQELIGQRSRICTGNCQSPKSFAALI